MQAKIMTFGSQPEPTFLKKAQAHRAPQQVMTFDMTEKPRPEGPWAMDFKADKPKKQPPKRFQQRAR